MNPKVIVLLLFVAIPSTNCWFGGGGSKSGDKGGRGSRRGGVSVSAAGSVAVGKQGGTSASSSASHSKKGFSVSASGSVSAFGHTVAASGSLSVSWGDNKNRRKRDIASNPGCIRTCDNTPGRIEVCTFVCTRICIPSSIRFANMTTNDVPKIFVLFDWNKDGYIDMMEMSETTYVSPECIIEPFQMADRDGNGILSKYEFDVAPWNFADPFGG